MRAVPSSTGPRGVRCGPWSRRTTAAGSAPIQAVTAKDGVHSIQKEASEIDVGDKVFCQVRLDYAPVGLTTDPGP